MEEFTEESQETKESKETKERKGSKYRRKDDEFVLEEMMEESQENKENKKSDENKDHESILKEIKDLKEQHQILFVKNNLTKEGKECAFSRDCWVSK